MKEKLKSLIELQEADLGQAKIKARKRELPGKIDNLEESIKALEKQVSENQKKYEESQKRQREKEEGLKRGQEALKKAKDRLFEVKTNKEYQAILKEMDGIESKNSELEDQIILGLDLMDRYKEEVAQIKKSFEDHYKQFVHEREELVEELESLDAEIVTCQTTLQHLRRQIPEDLLKRYDMIKAVNNGIAVVAAWKEVCEGCHMHIPPKLYNDLQRLEELMFCPNCHCIIYWYNKGENNQ